MTTFTNRFNELANQVTEAFPSETASSVSEAVRATVNVTRQLEEFLLNVQTDTISCWHNAKRRQSWRSQSRNLLESFEKLEMKELGFIPFPTETLRSTLIGKMDTELIAALLADARPTPETHPLRFLARRSMGTTLAELHPGVDLDEQSDIARVERKIRELVIVNDYFTGTVTALSDRNISCDHQSFFAGGVQTTGNRIFSAKELIRNVFEDVEKLLKSK